MAKEDTVLWLWDKGMQRHIPWLERDLTKAEKEAFKALADFEEES